MENLYKKAIELNNNWKPNPGEDLSLVPTGDMPGDKINIESEHIRKANTIFPDLLKEITKKELYSNVNKIVISIYGGSGVGKSETGCLIAHMFSQAGIGCYVLSGDNYPNRIPEMNDTERLRTYRTSAVESLARNDIYNEKIKKDLLELWDDERDFDSRLVYDFPWLYEYQKAGYKGLYDYLSSEDEINFHEINEIIRKFKSGNERIFLKRLGRTEKELWYDEINFSEINILLIEWTHGNNPNLDGVDIPVFLSSTPEETLAHRLKRSRDGNTDTPLITTVLGIEQKKLMRQAKSAKIIVSKSGEVISYKEFTKSIDDRISGIGPMLNAYPDSIGNRLESVVSLLKSESFKDCFESFYILPSLYNTDLDRGFSVIDYGLNESLVKDKDLEGLQELGIDLKFDFILNHLSVLSKQFQDIIKNGRESKYFDFFIEWNKFWKGCGELNSDGVLVPDDKYIKNMFFRKPGLPILKVRMPDGEEVPFWNTFYQEVKYSAIDALELVGKLEIQYSKAVSLAEIVNEQIANGVRPQDLELCVNNDIRQKVINLVETRVKYLGQMDLNIDSPLVWEFYEDTLKTLSSYGASLVRLDAFAYAPKTPGKNNFMNTPETWDLLDELRIIADKYDIKLLPEIHSEYKDGVHTKISEMGFASYDFFFPGLLIDAIERKSAKVLKRWIKEILENKMTTVNMLGCHDGIPLLDLKGLLSEQEIKSLIDIIVSRGGMVKDLHGKKNIYYQVNATYFSALGEDNDKLIFSRAVQMFMPGKPQIWYLDLFAGKNNLEAVEQAGPSGHKEINRTNLSENYIYDSLNKDVVSKQLRLINFRNTHPAFCLDSRVLLEDTDEKTLNLKWQKDGNEISLLADFNDCSFSIVDSAGEEID